MENGKWKMEKGEIMDNMKWMMENGKGDNG